MIPDRGRRARGQRSWGKTSKHQKKEKERKLYVKSEIQSVCLPGVLDTELDIQEYIELDS